LRGLTPHVALPPEWGKTVPHIYFVRDGGEGSGVGRRTRGARKAIGQKVTDAQAVDNLWIAPRPARSDLGG